MNSKHDVIWDLLSKYNFDVEWKNYQDLMCIICKRLLINAYQSSCGCRYCYDCIENYLQNEKKVCPGKMEDCKELMININDVHVDHVANVKVSKIQVKCPEAFCKFTDELRKIEVHINSHQIKCPYFDIGCNKLGINCSNIGNHMTSDHIPHATLMMDSIQNMKNEISSLKEDLYRKDCFINIAQSNLEKVKLENSNHYTTIELLKRDVNEYRMIIRKLQDEVLVLNNDMKIVKNTNNKKEMQINTLTKKVSSLAGISPIPTPTHVKGETMKLPLRIGFNARESSIESTNRAATINTKMKPEIVKPQTPMAPLYKIVQNYFSPFTWKIENFSEKRNSAKNVINSFILSDSFYSHLNGYKMCLTLYPDGCSLSKNAWLCVGFHLLEGEHDIFLQWPMMLYVTIGLVDQKSGEIQRSETFHYDSTIEVNKNRFSKPNSGMNKARGTLKFINLNGMVHNGKLCRNDTIIIKCFVEKSIPGDAIANNPIQSSPSDEL